jgi:hypothetical protein
MLPEPPEFDMGNKVSFKYITREKKRTKYTREVGKVVAIAFVEPFYEFRLDGEFVNEGRWYRQTELDRYEAEEGRKIEEERNVSGSNIAKEKQGVASHTALQENETMRVEIERLRGQFAAFCRALDDHEAVKAELETARRRIAELELDLDTLNIEYKWVVECFAATEAASEQKREEKREVAKEQKE